MPRTVQEILDHADELVRRFEDYEPDPSGRRNPGALVAVRDAVIARSEAERALAAIVRDAHSKGYSWQSIGRLLGTSGEAARQRYGKASGEPEALTTGAEWLRSAFKPTGSLGPCTRHRLTSPRCRTCSIAAMRLPGRTCSASSLRSGVCVPARSPTV